MTASIDIVMPVHNEASSIEQTIDEALEHISRFGEARVIACEDGSSDGTAEVLRRMAETRPLKLISGAERKGYGTAVLGGLRAAEAEYVVTMDSDGQIDPSDFPRLWEARGDSDMVVGDRTPRRDPLPRRLMSRAFFVPYRLLFGVPLRDPSCSFMLARKEVVSSLAGFPPEMVEGYWWEFRARAWAHGYRIEEVQINHRVRSAGTTQVYRPAKLLGIGTSHFASMWRLRGELGRRRNGDVSPSVGPA